MKTRPLTDASRTSDQIKEMSGQVQDWEESQGLLQQIRNLKMKSKAHREMSQQTEDRIHELNTNLHEKNALDNRFNVRKEEKEALC